MEEQVIASLRALLTQVLAECDLVRLPACERRGNVAGGGVQLVCQRKGIGGGLRGAGSGVGPRDGGGVTDDDDAAGDHMVGSEVADRLDERLCRRLDNFPEGQWKQVLCFTVKVLDPPVGEQAFGNRVPAARPLRSVMISASRRSSVMRYQTQL